MELVNRLGIAATVLPAMSPDGAPLLVLVAKATFELPSGGATARLADEQPSVREEDEFEGEPGLTPPKYEAETAPYKRQCEILVTGSAYAPGRPARSVQVGLQAGTVHKRFEVLGERFWQKAGGEYGGLTLGDCQPFERLGLSYALAYGGADARSDNPDQAAVWADNPVGRGFYASGRPPRSIEGQPAPQTQLPQQPPRDPWFAVPSLGFGPLGRNWQPRLRLAGRFDEQWREERFPMLPLDFNPEHWQSAPFDQRLDSLTPGLQIQLWNLSAEGYVSFHLPVLAPQVLFTRGGRATRRPLRADTLLIEPDAGRFSLIWRAHWPLRRGTPSVDNLELDHA